jgi:membrane associated rhomboid family serine protease
MIPIRDENPTDITPFVTVAFIAACVLAYTWQASHDPAGEARISYSLGMIPAVLFKEAALDPKLVLVPPAATVFTSMFLHGGFMHLAGNMLYLWIFGNNVEDAMGHVRFILFYLICGVAAALTQALVNPAAQIPMIGASGAVSGVLGAYLLLHPHARVLVFIPFGLLSQMIHLSAFWVLGLWFGIQVLNSVMTSSAAGGVAWYAHIGGFVAGMALIPLFKYRRVKLFSPD